MVFPQTVDLSLLWYLMPGFVAAWTYFALTAHRKPSAFERTVQAFIFTAFIFGIVFLIKWGLVSIGDHLKSPYGEWTANTSLTVSFFVGILLGLLFSYASNTNALYNKFLLKFITRRTSYPSQWFSAFSSEDRYVYLHLEGDRRIYGWPDEWPDHPDEGHFILMEPEWILDDNTRVPLLLIEKMLIPASEVVMVEMEKPEDEWDFSETTFQEGEKKLVDLRKDKSMRKDEKNVQKKKS